MNALAERAGPSSMEVMASLERVLASDLFLASAQLSRFLRYVVENRLAPDSAPLKESSIGLAVFRRAAGYDPKTDPIVRVEARRLRSRLDIYYAGVGAQDPVRISLPKGGYTPEFKEVASEEVLADAVPKPVAVAEVASEGKWPFHWWILAAAGLVFAGLGFAAWQARAPERLVHRFWSSILDSGKPVLVVPADSGLVMLQNLRHQPVSLRDYMTGEYRGRTYANGDLEAKTIAGLGQRRYTSMADLDFTLRISRRPEAARLGVRTRYARDLRMEELRANNVILLGARHSNPWVELFERDAAFRIELDESTATFRVVTASAPADIVVSASALQREVFGIVSYHKNREGSGVALVVGGTSVAGTEAAATLLLDDGRMMPLLRKAWDQGAFRGFDILVRDRNLGGGEQRAEVAAFHVDP